MSIKKRLAWVFTACALGFSSIASINNADAESIKPRIKTESIDNTSITEISKILRSSRPLSDSGIISLQRHLKTLGFFKAGFSPHFGPKTSKAVAGFIKAYPENVNSLNPHTLRPLIKYGYLSTLKKAAEQDSASFIKTIQTQITDMGGTAGKMKKTSYHSQHYLQSLLAIAGYNDKANIDGKWGSRTQKAVYTFQAGNNITPTVDNPDRYSKSKSSKTVIIGKPYPTTGDNGYGVSNAAIERAWASITGGQKPPLPMASNDDRPLIVLDPGHNSIDSDTVHSLGAKSPFEFVNGKNLDEDYLASRLVADLAKELHNQGYRVAFTRAPDMPIRIGHNYDLSLSARPIFAHNLSAELGIKNVTFISVHADATGLKTNTHRRGGDVYVRGGSGSKKLAKEIAESYHLEDTQGTDVRYGNFSVLRHFEQNSRYDAKDAAVLLELGFLDHRLDAAILKDIATDQNTRNRVVLEILTAIDKHHNGIGLAPKGVKSRAAQKKAPPKPNMG